LLLISFFDVNGLVKAGADGLGDNVREGRGDGLAHMLSNLVLDIDLGVNLTELVDFLVIAGILEGTAILVLVSGVVGQLVLVRDGPAAATAEGVEVKLSKLAAVKIEGTEVAVNVVAEGVLTASVSSVLICLAAADDLLVDDRVGNGRNNSALDVALLTIVLKLVGTVVHISGHYTKPKRLGLLNQSWIKERQISPKSSLILLHLKRRITGGGW
jgi:hypothetical protein